MNLYVYCHNAGAFRTDLNFNRHFPWAKILIQSGTFTTSPQCTFNLVYEYKLCVRFLTTGPNK